MWITCGLLQCFLSAFWSLFFWRPPFTADESESDVTYGQVWWPILGICALQITHPKCTQQWTKTHCEHTQPIYTATPVEQLGVRCLAQGHLSRAIEGGKSAVHSLPPPTIPAGLKLELTTFGLRVRLSNIRPRLPPWFTGEQVMQNFSKSFWITKQIHLYLGWPEREYIFIFSFLLFYN